MALMGVALMGVFSLVRYSAEEIEEKVSSFRMMLQEKQDPPPPAAEKPT